MSVSDSAILTQILNQLQTLQVSQQALQAKVRLNAMMPIYYTKLTINVRLQLDSLTNPSSPISSPQRSALSVTHESLSGSTVTPPNATRPLPSSPTSVSAENVISDKERERILYPGRVMLTSKLFMSRFDIKDWDIIPYFA